MASLLFRNGVYYLQYYVSGRVRRRSLKTDSYQLARDHQRQFESAELRGTLNPLPTGTQVPDILQRYVEHVRTLKTAKSAQTDIYYLREAFGPICDGLKVTSRRLSEKARKRPLTSEAKQDRRVRPVVIEATVFEAITTAQISAFIGGHVRQRGLAPKTANRYREILVRLFNWAQKEGGVRMPGNSNPAASVERYRERAPEISFLTLAQVDEQLAALAGQTQLQTMVAMLIFAGLRREEILWLTHEDVDFTAGPYGMLRIRAKTIGEMSWQPKTKVNRAVPISSRLRKYLDLYKPRKTLKGWYFPSPEGTWWDPDNFSADLRVANRKASLRWACLEYRHTFGSQLAMKGESLYKIATLMGNSPEICRRHYAALLPEALTDSVEFPTPKLCLVGTEVAQTA